MKIRMGFVSNSSSTSYVIALTRDFKATPEQLEKFIDECKGYEEDAVAMTPEQATETITNIVEALCETGSWSWCDSYDINESDERLEHLHPFRWACGDSFDISEVDGGHGSNFLHNILADDIKEKMTKITGIKNEDS